MTTSELRLGNYVSISTTGKIKKVVEIYHTDKISLDIRGIDHSGYYGIFRIDEVEGVPITEDRLLALGFLKDYKKGYIGIDVHNSDFVLTAPQVMGEWQENYAFQYTAGNLSKFRELKYIHQLQNLYFALTGEELYFKS